MENSPYLTKVNKPRVVDSRLTKLGNGLVVEEITTEVDDFLCVNFGQVMSVPEMPKLGAEEEAEMDRILERLKTTKL